SLSRYVHHRYSPPFPTRRSSDLQFMLLLGYVYAHLLARVRNVKKQMLGHVFVLLLPLAFLPIRFSAVSTESLSQHPAAQLLLLLDRKSTRLNSSHEWISYAVFCL